MFDSATSVFRFEHLNFAYPYGEPVLRDISLSLRPGERVCILGPNGCGKSTMLKIMAGLLYAGTGSFNAFGEEITERKMDDGRFSNLYHTKVGFIFQDADAQLFCSTVLEEIAFGPLQQGFKPAEAERRTQDVLKLLQIEKLRDKTPFKLSGGEKRKAAFASVLVMNPDVLVLDEPLDALDPRSKRWFTGLLTELNTAGKTIIFSTHDLTLAEKLAKRAILMDEAHGIAGDIDSSALSENESLLRDINII